MRNRANDILGVRNQIQHQQVKFTEELQQQLAQSEPGRKRRVEERKAWEELIKSSKVEPSKFVEHQMADETRAKGILADVEKHHRGVTPDILSFAQDQLAVNSNLFAPPDTVNYWDIPTVEHSLNGNCAAAGIRLLSDEIKPRTYANGSGTGWGDDDSASANCGLWYGIGGWQLNQPLAKITLWPFIDMHGYFAVRSNDGWLTSKEAEIKLTIWTVATQNNQAGYYNYAKSGWVVRDRGSDNIDESGRIDYTGYVNNGHGLDMLVVSGIPVTIHVYAELWSYARGSGSFALLDFQTGDGNGIRIPYVRVLYPQAAY